MVGVASVALLFTSVAAGCSGNDEAAALATDIRNVRSPVVGEVSVIPGSWLKGPWVVDVNLREGTSIAAAQQFWCEVLIPTWERRSLAAHVGSIQDAIDLEVFGTSVGTKDFACDT